MHWYTGVFAQRRDLCYSDLWVRRWFRCCLLAVGDRSVLTLLSTPSSISKGSYFFLQHMAPLYAFCHKLIQAAEEMHYTISLCSSTTYRSAVCMRAVTCCCACNSFCWACKASCCWYFFRSDLQSSDRSQVAPSNSIEHSHSASVFKACIVDGTPHLP